MNNMESDGPYKMKDDLQLKDKNGNLIDDFVVLGNVQEILIANLAFAEGRKSMEKEFQKAIGWADSICFDWNYSKDYKKWKKARGIDSLTMTKHWPSERFTKGRRVKMVEGTKIGRAHV